MKKIFYLFLVFAICACGKINPDNGHKVDTGSIKISNLERNLSSGGTTLEISFETSNSWNVSTNVDWLSLSEASGNAGKNTIFASVDENKEYDQREAHVVITSGKELADVRVIQKQLDAILLSSNNVIIDSDGGTPTLEVKSNVNYSCEVVGDAKSWISVENVGTKVLVSKDIVLNIAKNDSREARQGIISLTSGDVTENITVYQSAGTSGPVTSLANTNWIQVTGSNTVDTISFRADDTYIWHDHYSDSLITKNGKYTKITNGKYELYLASNKFAYTAEIINQFLYILRDDGKIYSVFYIFN